MYSNRNKILFILLIFINLLFAQNIKIIFITGDITLYREDGTKTTPVLNDKIFPGNRIVTGKASTLDIKIEGYGYLRIGSSSDITFDSVEKTLKTETLLFFEKKIDYLKLRLNMKIGNILSNIKPKKLNKIDFEIKTYSAILGVRGTIFETRHNKQTRLKVLRGKVSARNPKFPKKIVNVNAGYSTTINSATPPSDPKPMSNNEISSIVKVLNGGKNKKNGQLKTRLSKSKENNSMANISNQTVNVPTSSAGKLMQNYNIDKVNVNVKVKINR